ncbi:CobW/HypB/UreG, nucleotide-binding domain [Acetitomaculum ruminis DSM 5522]|uniref:CobW/HypB/UreG, nucleotide-binding domain n=1 Tax=Acetitomaculum ruminis DSM 5522 TaxID=1120918 RepID=A0A1I0Z5Z9_9FIRM|nr:GTP-binding protein [Acetitomaculum ruminis]SFB20536.1 CobW/HypB/UreG, nucleotide-binding domain [Acetitomaculum ruminis DSM 5522]
MKILILGGFLGSGKTSVLMSLAHYIVDNSTSDSSTKVAIIENEIGETGIDDKFIRNDGYNVENLFSGCACCSLSGELMSAINNIEKNMNPEYLIIEATGVAFPGDIKEKIKDILKKDSKIIVICDSKRWKRLLNAMSNLIEGQLDFADNILINKIDLVEKDVVEAVKESITKFNSTAPLYEVAATNGIDNSIWNNILK